MIPVFVQARHPIFCRALISIRLTTPRPGRCLRMLRETPATTRRRAFELMDELFELLSKG